MNYDVAVIGAGVIGSLIARELSRYNLRIALVDKCNDMAMGTSKANSAIVHAGFDAKPGSLKAKFNVEGTALMPEICRTLGVPFKPVGSLVVAFSDEEVETLGELLERGNTNGVPGLEIYDREKLREAEPCISDEAKAALWAPSAGIVCPIISEVDTIGSVVFLSENNNETYGEVQEKLAQAAAGFLAKQMES